MANDIGTDSCPVRIASIEISGRGCRNIEREALTINHRIDVNRSPLRDTEATTHGSRVIPHILGGLGD